MLHHHLLGNEYVSPKVCQNRFIASYNDLVKEGIETIVVAL